MKVSSPAPRIALMSAGLILIAIVAYWPSVGALWGYWTDSNYGGTHGLLVAPLALWLLFRARHRLDAVTARPSPAAGVLLLLGSIAWFVFCRAGIQTLHILMFPVLMGLAVWAAFGFRAALCVAFPLAFLYFAVPAWGIFVSPLQALTQAAVAVLGPVIGVPAQLQGDLVILPGVGAFEIARGCSGANFLATGLAVAALLGELEEANLWRRALLVGVMAVVAIISNWIRVLVVIDAGYTTNMRHVLVSRGHLLFGWVLFTTVMVAFVWLFARPQTATPASRVSGPRTAHATRMPAYIATVATLVGMPVVVYTFVASLDVKTPPLSFKAPAGRAEWQGPSREAADLWRPSFVGPHSQWSVAYQGPTGQNVETVAIGYTMQGQGRELVNEQNSLFAATPFEPVAENKVTLGGQSYIEVVAADDHNQRTLVWYVYDIGGREFVTPLFSQLWYGVRSLGGPPYSVLFAFRTACRSSCDSARDTLRSFVKVMGPDFYASVRPT
jgi:EpsI family protein